MDGVDEIVAEFLVESYENLEQLAQELVELEHNPTGHELLASVFRSIHTIKGTSGFLGFSHLEKVTHVGESLLSRLRDGLQQMSPEIADALLAMSDAVNAILQTIERTGEEGDVDNSALIQTLAALQSDAPAPAPKPEAVPVATSRVALPKMVGEILIDSGLVSLNEVSLAVHEQELGDQRGLGKILAEHGAATPAEVEAIIEAAQPAATPATPAPVAVTKTPPKAEVVPPAAKGGVAKAPSGGAAQPSLSSATVRVDVRLLDELMNLVGELVLARNQIMEYNTGQRTPMAAAAQRLDLITTELQARVMTTRMQPVGSAWNRFPRLVRDVSAACGKNVRLEMEGAETELDRSLIESITDPLTHIVRNSVDHGIETPAERLAKG